MEEKRTLDLSKIDGKVMTMEQWTEEHVIRDFVRLGNDSVEAEKFRLRPIAEDDLFFTDEIEDDRVNCTAELADYDWTSYAYEARFPTKTLGMLAVRQEYFGMTTCQMEVRQFLPAYLTGRDDNVVVSRRWSYPADLFMKYMVKDLQARIENASSNSSFAYSPEDLMLEWFSKVIENYDEEETKAEDVREMKWESVRVPKKNDGKRILTTYGETSADDEFGKESK